MSIGGDGQFLANVNILRSEGRNLTDLAGTLSVEVEKIYKEVEDMATKNYLSPEAVALKLAIDTKKVELEGMCTATGAYGDYNTLSAKAVEDNQQRAIDNI